MAGTKWFAFLHDFFQLFKCQNIMTEDVVRYFNEKLDMDPTPIFDEYLRHNDLPVLELRFNETGGSVAYRWKAHEAAFAMPIRVGTPDHWQIIKPNVAWQILRTPIKKDEFQIPTDLYYVWVAR